MERTDGVLFVGWNRRVTDTMIPGIIPSGHNDSKGSFKNGGLKVRLKGRSGKIDAFPTKTERKSAIQRKK